MNKQFKVTSLIFAVVMAISLVFNPIVSAQDNRTLNVPLALEPVMDPAVVSDHYSGTVVKNIFEGLTRTDQEGVPQPAMAENWDVSEDGLTYTFNLRTDAVWSNGEPVTAHDFVYSWKRVLNPETAAPFASELYEIKGAEAYNTGEGSAEDVLVQAVDDWTLEVVLENPTPYFVELTGSKYTYLPVHQATVESNPEWAIDATEAYVTNGPFTLSGWNHHSDLTLAKNGTYWDAENVFLESVNVAITESLATANASFLAGELDYLGLPFITLSVDSVDIYKKEETLNVNDYAAVYLYKFNTTDPVLNNKNIRKALAYAIDREGLVEDVLKAGQKPAIGIVPPTVDGFNEDRDYYANADYAKAQDFLAAGMEELGLSDPSEINFEVSSNSNESHSIVTQYIIEGWQQNLGVNAVMDNKEMQVHMENMAMLNYQVGRMGYSPGYNDATAFLGMFETVDTGGNDTGWENAEYKELLDKAANENDPETRTSYLVEAEELFMEEMPAIPVYFYSNAYVTQPYVDGLAPDPIGNVQLKDVVLGE